MGKPNTALVLLHGYCEDSSLWNDITPNLNFEGEIITPNLPGFGNTELISNKFTLEDIATSIYNNLKDSGVEKCICIGHSLGGYITLALKDTFPNFVSSIGLLHSTSFADTSEKIALRNKLIKFLNHNPPKSFLTTFAPSLFLDTNKNKLRPKVEKVINMSNGLDSKPIQAYAKAMRDRKDYSELLYNEEQPLFIAGEMDELIPIADSKKQISKIKNPANCYLLENVAHIGMYESPSIIINAINKFVSNNR